MDTDRPFRFRAHGEVELEVGIPHVGADGIMQMDLTDLFAHVLPDTIDPDKRVLPYHWDFAFSDHYRVEIQFDRPVDLLNASTLFQKVSTSVSSYERIVHQSATDRIVIEAKLIAGREREFPAEIHRLADLIHHAQENVVLQFRSMKEAQSIPAVMEIPEQ